MTFLDLPLHEMARPPAIVHEVRKRRRRDRASRRGVQGGIVIGTILIMSDGTRCQVTHFDETGQPWCVPLDQ